MKRIGDPIGPVTMTVGHHTYRPTADGGVIRQTPSQLLAERRALVEDLRGETDKAARKFIEHQIAEIDRQLKAVPQ